MKTFINQQGSHKYEVNFSPTKKIRVYLYRIATTKNKGAGVVKGVNAFKYNGEWFTFRSRFIEGKFKYYKVRKIINPELDTKLQSKAYTLKGGK